MAMNDIFHKLRFGAPLVTAEQITASGKLGNVLDRRDLDNPNDLVGFLVVVDAAATADATNYFELTIHEADEKTDATTLTSGAIANVKDVLGYTEDGVRSRTTNPAYDANVTATAQTELQYLQDGTWPKINATGQAGATFWFSYRGYKDCLQIFGAETGTADVTVTVVPVYMSMETQNLVNPA